MIDYIDRMRAPLPVIARNIPLDPQFGKGASAEAGGERAV